jgi:hypothetical protein
MNATQPQLKLTQCMVVEGMITDEVVAGWAGKPWPEMKQVDTVRLAREQLGRFYLECTLLTEWQGEGGPWHVSIVMEDNFRSGIRSQPRHLGSIRVRNLAPGSVLTRAFSISRSIEEYCDIVVMMSVNETPVNLVRIAVVEPKG